MRSSILAASMVVGLTAAAPARADTSSSSVAALGDDAFTSIGEHDLDPVGEGIVIGDHARLETPRGPVHVWTPRGYAPETAMTVVYVHGYQIDVDQAWWGHGLPEQFGLAAVNAMFIACAAPQGKHDAVSWTSLSALLDAVRASGRPLPKGPVAAIGHSGAYRTLEHWVRDRRLDTMVLLDAGYGQLWWVRQWLLGKPHRRLINVGDDTRVFTDRLHRSLPGTLTLQGFGAFADPAQVERLARERIVYVRTTIGHHDIASGALALPAVLRILGAPRLDS
jgi:hypothetical protein